MTKITVKQTIESGQFQIFNYWRQNCVTLQDIQLALFEPFVNQILNRHQFLELENRNKKTLNTSGSDAGSTFIMSCYIPSSSSSSSSSKSGKNSSLTSLSYHQMRREIKNSDQKSLASEKQLENFVKIEQLLLDWLTNQLMTRSLGYRSVQVSIHRSIVQYFCEGNNGNVTPFCLSFMLDEKSGEKVVTNDGKHAAEKLLIYMTDDGDVKENNNGGDDNDGGYLEKVTVMLPANVSIHFMINEYNMMMDESDNDGGGADGDDDQDVDIVREKLSREQVLEGAKLKVLLPGESNSGEVKCFVLSLADNGESSSSSPAINNSRTLAIKCL